MLYETSTTKFFAKSSRTAAPLPKDPQPSWKGYSVGRWEGDTLVVDTIGFNNRGWIDTEKGRPQTEALHVTERFRRRNVGHLELGITIDDPKAYTKPWSAKLSLNLVPDTDSSKPFAKIRATSNIWWASRGESVDCQHPRREAFESFLLPGLHRFLEASREAIRSTPIECRSDRKRWRF